MLELQVHVEVIKNNELNSSYTKNSNFKALLQTCFIKNHYQKALNCRGKDADGLKFKLAESILEKFCGMWISSHAFALLDLDNVSFQNRAVLFQP